MLPLACAIAARTKRIQIGTSVLLLPLHDPLRVAEDAATVDVMSNGRLSVGVAGGYRKGEFTGFGIPPSERAARHERGAADPAPAVRGRRVTTRDARFYRYTDVELTPLPVQQKLKLWVGGFSEPAVRRAARLGDAYISTGPILPLATIYRDELRRLGKNPTNTRSPPESPGSWSRATRETLARGRGALPVPDQPVRAVVRGGRHADRRGRQEPRRPGGRGAMIVFPRAGDRDDPELPGRAANHALLRWTLPPGLPPEWATSTSGSWRARSSPPSAASPVGQGISDLKKAERSLPETCSLARWTRSVLRTPPSATRIRTTSSRLLVSWVGVADREVERAQHGHRASGAGARDGLAAQVRGSLPRSACSSSARVSRSGEIVPERPRSWSA